MKYALDTNIVIHLIRGTPSVTAHYEECLLGNKRIIIPPYVDYEVRRGLRYTNATSKERIYELLCHGWNMAEMGRNVWLRAVSLYSEMRHKGFTVSDADILISSFCLENKCVLVTNNTKDFVNVEGLNLEDWVR